MKSIILRPVFMLLIMQLFFQLNVSAQVAVSSGGTGAPAGSGLNGANNAGGDATGLGCGGGGGSWWGGTGGAGKYGGGGGGAGGYFSLGAINWAGGEGGQGVVVIALYNGASLVNAVVLNNGNSYTVSGTVTSAKVWAIGGGGGGGGATESDGTSGGSGGAGGVCYITKAVTNGSVISYSIGGGGLAGHGAVAGTAGGTTSVTIAGSTIYAYGGGAGLYNSGTTATGGSYSGGDGGAVGGNGYPKSGDTGGGGGAAIGGVTGTQNGNSGGTGANAADVSGLFAACASATLSSSLPVISIFSPTSGLSGTVITITGTGFTGVTGVRLGGTAVSSYTVNSSTQITATVAPGNISGSITVLFLYTSVSKPIYLVQIPATPSMSGFSPASAQRGQVVTISGSSFLGVTSVLFGGTPAASYTLVSDYTIQAVVGSGTSGSVSVSNASGSSTQAGFSWLSTTQASAVHFSAVQSGQMTIGWTNGNANARAVFMKEGSGIITNPTDLSSYSASCNFGTPGSQLGGCGYYCVYNGTGNSVTVTGLKSFTNYTVQVFEYNGSAGAELYYTVTAANNPNTQRTLSALPVTWVDFSVKEDKNKALLSWTVANETQAKDYIVQTSTDGQQWTNAGTVPARNADAAISAYSFVHDNPVQGINYYRLLQRDIDGKYCYSKIVLLAVQLNRMLLQDNPVTDGKIRLRLNEPQTVSLYSMEGRLLICRSLGTGLQQIDITSFSRGVYLLKAGGQTIRVLNP